MAASTAESHPRGGHKVRAWPTTTQRSEAAASSTHRSEEDTSGEALCELMLQERGPSFQ